RVRAQVGARVQGSCVPEEPFLGLRGEVCVYAGDRNAALVVTLDCRELERVELKSAIAFDAVIDSREVEPADRYRGVTRDLAFTAVLRGMRATVVAAIEAIVARTTYLPADKFVLGGDPNVEQDMRLVRAALVLARSLGFQLRG